MKCLTIVITLFVVCLWCSILFLDRWPKHCHWDFALIVIVKITLLFLLFLAVWSPRRSPTCFGVIWSVFNSLCMLSNSRDKFEDTEILYWAPLSYKPPKYTGSKIITPTSPPAFLLALSSFSLVILYNEIIKINNKMNSHFMWTDPVCCIQVLKVPICSWSSAGDKMI